MLPSYRPFFFWCPVQRVNRLNASSWIFPRSLSCFIFLFTPSLMLLPPGSTLSNECLWPWMYFCVLLNSVVWVCFYLHRCVCCYAMALVLFLTSFHWTLCLQGTTAVSPVQLVRTSDGFSLSLCAPAHWTHPYSKDGHIGGLPSHCHTFSNTLTQADCWVTICNMKKTDIFTSVVQQDRWPRSYVVCALILDMKTKSFGLCFPKKERLEVHSTGAITRDVLIMKTNGPFTVFTLRKLCVAWAIHIFIQRLLNSNVWHTVPHPLWEILK